MTSERKTTLMRVVKIILAAGIIGFLIDYVDPAVLLASIKTARYGYILIALLLLVPNIVLQYLKWRLICARMLDTRESARIWKSLFYGIGAGSFTPMKLGEYFARAIPFRDRRVAGVMVATAVDKIIPMLLLIIFGTAAMVYFLYTSDYAVHVTRGGVPALVVLAVGILVVLTVSKASVRHKVWRKLKSFPVVSLFVRDIAQIKSIKAQTVANLTLLSVLFHLTFTTQMSFLLCAFAGETNFFLYLIIANLIVFTHFIVSPVGLGEIAIREGAAVFYTQAYGLAGAIGFNAALLLTVINIGIPALTGLILFFTRDN